MTRLILIAATVIFAATFTSCNEDKEKICIVAFNSNEGSEVASQTVKEGAKATKPDDPSCSGYTFAAWYKEAALANEWKFDTDVVIEDIMLHAKWTQNTFTVTFNSNDGSEVTSQIIAEGAKTTEPKPAPTREGYYFGGWYTDNPALTNKWDFDTQSVTGDITLYARWGTVKLLETWTNENAYYYKFEYDEQNRITKIMSRYFGTNTLTYEGDDLVEDGSFEYTKSGNTIILKQKSNNKLSIIEMNSDGLPETWIEENHGGNTVSIVTTYYYQMGNLTACTELITYADGETDGVWYNYQYDTNKGALYHCNTPTWYLMMHLNYFGVRNNITHHSYKYNDEVYTCEFDDAGFPIKRSCKENFKGVREWEEVFTYITK